MFGVALAALSSIILATADAGKKELAKFYAPFQVGWVTLTAALLCNVTFLYLTNELAIPSGYTFYLCTLACAVAATVGEIAFITAVSSADLSLVIPFSAFGPVGATLLSALILKELPSPFAFLGILIIVLGSYLISVDFKSRRGIFAPFRIAFTKGPLCMLLATGCFSIMVTLQKFLARDVNSVLSFTSLVFVCVVVFTLVLLWQGKNPLEPVLARPKHAIGMGICWAVGMTTLYVSLGFTLVAYASSASRIGMLFSVLLGYLFFNEKNILQRLLAGSVMIVGVVLVVWFG